MKIDGLVENYIDGLVEQIERLDSIMIDLEQGQGDEDSLREYKRIIHSIKGSAGSYGLDMISSICHNIEDHLENIGLNEITTENSNLFFEYCDFMKEFISKISNGEIISQGDFDQKLIALSLSSEGSSGHRTLIVESSPAIAKAIATALQEKGISTSYCSNTTSALQRIINEDFDSLISSNQFDKITGMMLIRMIKAGNLDRNGLKCVLVSSKVTSTFEKNLKPDETFLKDGNLLANITEYLDKLVNNKFHPNLQDLDKSHKFIFIDDDESIHAILKLAIKKFQNLECEYCFNSKEFATKLKVFTPDFIISDFNLDKESGADIINIMKREGFNYPVFFLTAETKSERHVELLNLGAKGILTKPIKPSTFVPLLLKKIAE